MNAHAHTHAGRHSCDHAAWSNGSGTPLVLGRAVGSVHSSELLCQWMSGEVLASNRSQKSKLPSKEDLHATKQSLRVIATSLAVLFSSHQVRGVRILLVAISDALRGSLGLPAAYIPIVASVSQVQARLQQGGLLSVSRAPLSLGECCCCASF